MTSIDPVAGDNTSAIPTYTDSSVFQHLTPTAQDSLTQSLSIAELNFLFPAIPTLAVPNNVSITSFFQSLGVSKLNFQKQLGVSKLVDQQTRQQANQASANQAAILTLLFADRANAVADAKNESQAQINALNQELATIKAAAITQEAAIQQINNGNAEQKARATQAINDYNNFISAIKQQLGATQNIDGSYTIPNGTSPSDDQTRLATYNNLAAQYNQQVASFNSYEQGRKSDLNVYNQDVATYNASASSYNQSVTTLIQTYDLSAYLTEHNIPSINQSIISSVDVSNISDQPTVTSSLSGLPATIQAPRPSDWVEASSINVPAISDISYPGLTSDQLNLILKGIYNNLYANNVSQIDAATQAANLFWGYLNALNLFRPNDALNIPLLNSKPLIKQLLPPTFIDATKPLATQSLNGANALSVQTIGSGALHLQGLLSQALVSAIIKQLNLSIGDQLAVPLSLLTAGLLTTNALQALLPAIGPLSTNLTSLPPNSPAYALLFSLSFANRILENIQQGLTPAAIETLLANIPGFANLSSTDQATLIQQLTPSLNLALLLTAAKLLESTLGLPGLAVQLLPSFLPSDSAQSTPSLASSNTSANESLPVLTPNLSPDFTQSTIDLTDLSGSNLAESNTINQIINQGIQEEIQSQANFQQQLNESFINQGFNQNEAQFLANVGTQLSGDLLSPSVTNVSSASINASLLSDSIKAGLVLSGIDLANAERLAQQTVAQTLAEETRSSASQFISALETNLRNAGVGKLSGEIAANAILLPKKDPRLPSLNSIDPAQFPQLSEGQLVILLRKRVVELLAPQLGNEFAKFATSEATKTLFGISLTTDKEVKSPYSLVNVVRNEIYNLNVKQNTDYTQALTDSFKEFIKTDINLGAFLEQLMDPSKLLVYSASTGIMYAGHEPSNWKKSIDILI